MKKFVSIALALVLALSLTVVAFAAGYDAITDDGAVSGELSKTITVTVDSRENIDKYAAVVTWVMPSTNMVYESARQTWDTETLQWTSATGDAADWAEEYTREGTVTIENRSSQAINTAVEVAGTTAVTVTAGTGAGATLAAATAGAEKGTTGVWDIAVDADVTTAYVATITVTIS